MFAESHASKVLGRYFLKKNKKKNVCRELGHTGSRQKVFF
jgi:hypothetical protein